ncbi:hypothetical protein Rhe02_36360 [Rhizocola hellebori]|uniref:NB-ARC domain-containing protein n=1 Tax=Rhizocola hellebori TaxID=1392758 RepID=A0A8J3Q8U4_9ACTN|nr:tetratricopeptide repeat protein [Rhizocola hellebori]GIH05569.1 hypothetical protein Rhe02_36360 [Rhizocola hellebori]
MPSPQSLEGFRAPADPGQAETIEELVERLRLLKIWAGDPSYEWIKDRVNAAWTAAGRPAGELAGKTIVADCFRLGRRRLNTDLVTAIVQALHPDVGYVTQWRQALQVVTGRAQAAAQVRVRDSLPPVLAGFTGRVAELAEAHRALHDREDDAAAVVSITGMAGVGKTELAVHLGDRLARQQKFDRIFFVNLRGFHPDAAQPPANPAAVLEGFLRLLGVPGQQIPHSLPARAAAYRSRLAGTRVLIVLDNAADEAQVQSLLPQTAGCLTLITSRRSLTDLKDATHLKIEVFSAEEAKAFLARSTPQTPIGRDPAAAGRIVLRCGRLPLALGLVIGHIRTKPGWTLTDHADRLDQRHRDRRMDTEMELAFDLSYRHQPAGRQRLLRLAALHPGDDMDAYAVAALTGGSLDVAESDLRRLHDDHLMQQSIPGRYSFHDLVRAYATGVGADEDAPSERRSALTRLFDHYLATTAAAMNTLHPVEMQRWPQVSSPVTATPDLTAFGAAVAWLDTERPTLVAVAAYTAGHGWLTHTIRLANILFRYLNGGYPADALIVHGHAREAAHHCGDVAAQAHALTSLGATHLQLSNYGPAAEDLQQAVELFRQVGDHSGLARALCNLGHVETWMGRYQPATDHFVEAMALGRQTNDPRVHARALINLGGLEARLGQFEAAVDHHAAALALCRETGDRASEATALQSLGHAEVRLGQYGSAAVHLREALVHYRHFGSRSGEAWTLNVLGLAHTRLQQHAQAIEYHQRALAIFQETADRDSEASAINGLGEAAYAAGRIATALAHHSAAYALCLEADIPKEQARAHLGIGHVHRNLVNPTRARWHYERALAIYTELGTFEADRVRADLAAIDTDHPAADG